MNKIPANIDGFQSLSGSFGIAGDTLGRAIVRDLYCKCGMRFTETPGRKLAECVEELKDEWNGEVSPSEGQI